MFWSDFWGVTSCNPAYYTFFLGKDLICDQGISSATSFERGLRMGESASKISPDKTARLQPHSNGVCGWVFCLQNWPRQNGLSAISFKWGLQTSGSVCSFATSLEWSCKQAIVWAKCTSETPRLILQTHSIFKKTLSPKIPFFKLSPPPIPIFKKPLP